jgi:hypothetical protein
LRIAKNRVEKNSVEKISTHIKFTVTLYLCVDVLKEARKVYINVNYAEVKIVFGNNSLLIENNW